MRFCMGMGRVSGANDTDLLKIEDNDGQRDNAKYIPVGELTSRFWMNATERNNVAFNIPSIFFGLPV